MLRSKIVRFSAVALVGFACVLATEARAQIFTAQTAPLSCTASLGGGKTVTITAGADSLPFPHDVPCTNAPGTCSEYTYKFTTSNASILTRAFLSVSSDLDIFSTTPSAAIENSTCEGDGGAPLIGRFVCEQRTVRFNQQPSGFMASVVVTRADPRVSTAGAIVGLVQTGFCLIQGPGAPGNRIAPVNIKATRLLVHDQCSVDVTTGPDGSFTSAVNSAGSTCVETFPTSLAVDGKEIQFEPGQFILIGPTSKQCGLIGGVRKCWCLNAAC